MNRRTLSALTLLCLLILPLDAFAVNLGSASPPEPLKGFSIPAGAKDSLTGPQYLARAEEGYLSGDYEKALEDYTLALPLLSQDADKARVHARLAFIYAATGKP